MDDVSLSYCGRCGEPELSERGVEGDHSACLSALTLEPPRYCARCRRRMVVQVTPTGWTATCSRHGESGARTSRTTSA